MNDIFEEKDRGDVFEIFIEGYLATQAITQHTEHWVVGGIPVAMRKRYNLPSDGTGIDGIYEERGGNQVAIPRDLFADILRRIDRLRSPSGNGSAT
mgnify:CR=1 FL=1